MNEAKQIQEILSMPLAEWDAHMARARADHAHANAMLMEIAATGWPTWADMLAKYDAESEMCYQQLLASIRRFKPEFTCHQGDSVALAIEWREMECSMIARKLVAYSEGGGDS